MRKILWASLFLIFYSCNTQQKIESFNSSDLIQANRRLLEIAMEDGFSPPVASRVYVYPHIAFYSVMNIFYPDSLPDLSQHLKDFPNISETDIREANPELTALICFALISKSVVFSEQLTDQLIQDFLQKAVTLNIPTQSINKSKEVAEQISKLLIPWIKKDNYLYTRTLDRYTSTKKLENWKETPPDYSPGLEPHWSKIRRLMLDSLSKFPLTLLSPYSESKTSDFYNNALDVYNTSNKLDTNQTNIALFWDDNPNVSKHKGHLVSMTHKISPPGHWLNIIGQQSKKLNSNIFRTSQAYTYTAIAMFDGIIDCWTTKYETNVVRPISYILEHIDDQWRPLIQTPPFPEFTSGHSVVSAAAAEILSNLYGKDVPFTDSTEVIFGHAPRNFSNFHEAAMEVSFSRYYGGIHYKHSVLEGNKQGIFIAQQILKKLKS